MKRFISLLLVLSIALSITLEALSLTDKVLTVKVFTTYYPTFGNVLNIQKNEGIILQQAAMKIGNSIPLYGSSELYETTNPFHPSNFFRPGDRLQVDLIGRAYCQSLIQLIDYGALGNAIKGKKIALIVSPQWFTKDGLTSQDFNVDFSEQQFFAFMSNPAISSSLKRYVAGRVRSLIGTNQNAAEVKEYCDLYLQHNYYSSLMSSILSPYYDLETNLLNSKDLVQSVKLLAQDKPRANSGPVHEAGPIDWNSEIRAAARIGIKTANNNSFYMDNQYYNRYVKRQLAIYKGYMKNESYSISPEYGDFNELLALCKQEDILPLIISIPVNGRWYDYCDFSKKDRSQYYANIRKDVISDGFKLADFSGHEYDKYFLRDSMHLGLKGWLYVDKALYSYFG